MTSFFLMFLKVKLVAHTFWILLFCAYSLGQSETILLLLFIVTSRSVPQPDLFLLPMQSVGALTSLIKIIFCFLILVSLLIKILFSLSLPFFCVTVFYCFLTCVWLSSCCQAYYK
jgi:hypothetical protein